MFIELDEITSGGDLPAGAFNSYLYNEGSWLPIVAADNFKSGVKELLYKRGEFMYHDYNDYLSAKKYLIISLTIFSTLFVIGILEIIPQNFYMGSNESASIFDKLYYSLMIAYSALSIITGFRLTTKILKFFNIFEWIIVAFFLAPLVAIIFMFVYSICTTAAVIISIPYLILTYRKLNKSTYSKY